MAWASDMSNNPSLLINEPYSNVSPSNGAVDVGYALHVNDLASQAGEDWSAVVYDGHGIYAHVEEVTNTQIINIEYTVLWPFNAATCDFHSGDMTTLVVEYDKGCDLLTRVTYNAHGCVIESFGLALLYQGINLGVLDGLDANNNQVSMNAAGVSCLRVRKLFG